MTMPRSTKDPFDSVRDAFSDLGTSEKAAFVLEATFATLGQALAETGRRAAAVVDALDIDAWFTSPPRAHPPPQTPPATGEAPPMPATPADLKKTAARKPAPKRKPSGKTPPKETPPPADDAT